MIMIVHQDVRTDHDPKPAHRLLDQLQEMLPIPCEAFFAKLSLAKMQSFTHGKSLFV